MFGKMPNYKGNRISPSQITMLVILRKGPMYGYEVLKSMRETFEGIWEPQTGAVYPALKRLEEQGLIRSEIREEKEYYSLTEEGDAWLKVQLDKMSQFLQPAARYFEFMNEAANEGRDPEERKAFTRQPVEGMGMMFMQLDELSPGERLKHMRRMREMLATKVEHLDEEIKRLEKESMEG